jgi:dipeptide transport system permease protein
VLNFLARRALQAVATLLGVSVITFALLKWMPGDPAQILCNPKAHECSGPGLAHLRHELGLDEPYWRQYADFVHGWVTLEAPEARLVWSKLPRTLELALGAIAIQIVFGLALGILAAMRHRRPADRLIGVLNCTFISLPVFVVGLGLLIFFTYPWGWFGGHDFSGIFNQPPEDPPSFTGAFVPTYWVPNLMLPSVSLALGGIALTAFITRTSLLEAMAADFVTTARGKGLDTRTVVGKHALKIALLPVVTILGLDLGRIIGGDVIIEAIYRWDGLGQLVIGAVAARNVPLVLGIVLLLSTVFVVLNAVVDWLYGALDPRIRVG